MAKVRATQVRVVIQYRDEAGHRLPSEKGVWKEILTTDILLLDCPKCPEPEPVKCGSVWHRVTKDDLQNSTVNYCPQCGKRLHCNQCEELATLAADDPGASPANQETAAPRPRE